MGEDLAAWETAAWWTVQAWLVVPLVSWFVESFRWRVHGRD